MQFKDEDIEEFIRVWKEEFGETISPDRARAEAQRLVDFFMALAERFRRGIDKAMADRGTMPP
jgi:hypothetical protein